MEEFNETDNPDPQKDTSAAQPVDASPESAQPQPTQPEPPTPAHEEADRAAPEPEDGDNETDDPEPELLEEDPGDDPEVETPQDLSGPSFEANPEDQHGADDHPEE